MVTLFGETEQLLLNLREMRVTFCPSTLCGKRRSCALPL